MRAPVVLFPAYGKKYSNEEEVKQAYLEGKDFRLHGMLYCSCRDFVGKEVSLCYGLGLYTRVTYNK